MTADLLIALLAGGAALALAGVLAVGVSRDEGGRVPSDRSPRSVPPEVLAFAARGYERRNRRAPLAVLVAALLSQGCALTLRYPWDRPVDQETHAPQPKPAPSASPEAK